MKHPHAVGVPKLGKRLRALRIRREESLQDVADAARMSKSHVWEIERGRNPNPTIGTLLALAAHFDVPIQTLVSP